MAAWLHRRKRNPENIEDDDDEETEKPKSRFSRLFKKLFPRIAARGTVDPIEQANNPLHELFTPLVSREATDERGQEQETKVSDSEESPSLKGSQEVQAVEQWHSPIVGKNEVVARLRSPNEHIAREIEEPLAIRNVEASNIRAAETPIFERRTENASVKREQVIEKRVAEPLAVLEYFLRRRAVKNVERQVKKESANLEKKLRQSNESNERLQDLSKKSQEQLQELRTKRQSAEKPIIEKVENTRTERIIERPSLAQVERTVSKEKTKAQIKSKTEASEYRAKEVPVQPERVLEQVLQAAEKNTPIEKLYEKRHETKDEPSKFDTGLSSGAVPIGSVIAQSYHQGSSSNQQTPMENTRKAVTKQAGMYRQAAFNGFWAALILIVAILTIALMQN